jgi:lysophospholipase L1-like esterase
MYGVSSNRRTWSFGLALALAALVSAPSARAQDQKDQPATTKPAPRSGSWMKQHESFLERAKEGNIDLLFLGDSITRGWDSKDEKGEGPREVWERHYGPRRAANFGIGGDRTQHVLWRIQNGEIDGISPKVVVLMIGTNNASSNTAEEIAEGIEAIVKTLHEKLPTTKVLLLGVFPRGQSPNPVREKLAAVNERIARLDDGKTVKYLDIGNRFLNEDGTISEKIMPDYLHLKREGYRIWADAMEPTLWSMLDEETVNKKDGKDK